MEWISYRPGTGIPSARVFSSQYRNIKQALRTRSCVLQILKGIQTVSKQIGKRLAKQLANQSANQSAKQLAKQLSKHLAKKLAKQLAKQLVKQLKMNLSLSPTNWNTKQYFRVPSTCIIT